MGNIFKQSFTPHQDQMWIYFHSDGDFLVLAVLFQMELIQWKEHINENQRNGFRNWLKDFVREYKMNDIPYNPNSKRTVTRRVEEDKNALVFGSRKSNKICEILLMNFWGLTCEKNWWSICSENGHKNDRNRTANSGITLFWMDSIISIAEIKQIDIRASILLWNIRSQRQSNQIKRNWSMKRRGNINTGICCKRGTEIYIEIY